MKIAIGITGASGTIYARRLLEHLLASESRQVETVAVIFTANGRTVAEYELPGFGKWLELQKEEYSGRLTEYANDDFFTPPASGSAGYDALVIVPCSMGMAGRIASGISDDLLTRAADVMLKENTPLAPRILIVCPRETPMSLIHLRNLTAIKEAGGTILPAIPAFYTRPQTLAEVADTVVLRILSQLGLKPEDYRGWQE